MPNLRSLHIVVYGDPGPKLDPRRERSRKTCFVTQDPGGTGLSADFGPLREGFLQLHTKKTARVSPRARMELEGDHSLNRNTYGLELRER